MQAPVALDRLLGLVLALDEDKPISAPALAQRLGVSQRTVYRDVRRLQDAGVPVVSEPGRGGGLRLMPGFRMAPLALTRSETLALTLAIEQLRALPTQPFAAALDTAARFAPASLPLTPQKPQLVSRHRQWLTHAAPLPDREARQHAVPVACEEEDGPRTLDPGADHPALPPPAGRPPAAPAGSPAAAGGPAQHLHPAPRAGRAGLSVGLGQLPPARHPPLCRSGQDRLRPSGARHPARRHRAHAAGTRVGLAARAAPGPARLRGALRSGPTPRRAPRVAHELLADGGRRTGDATGGAGDAAALIRSGSRPRPAAPSS
ncbi:MAG: HTH domain-containing protein [Inhella sp.]